MIADHPPVTRPLDVSDINWTLPAAPEPECDPDDLVTDALVDALAYRLVVQECFDELRRLTLALDGSRAEVARLREAHRAQTAGKDGAS